MQGCKSPQKLIKNPQEMWFTQVYIIDNPG